MLFFRTREGLLIMDDDNSLINSASHGVESAISKQTENIAQTLGRWCSELMLQSDVALEWRIKNLKNISDRFESICKRQGLTELEKGEVAKKFGIKWIRGASLEDEPALQDFWAKLLINEISHGGVGSRALDTLENMSRKEADIFIHACNMALYADSMYFIHLEHSTRQYSGLPRNPLGYYNLNISDLVLLEELGLLNISTSHSVTIEFGELLQYQSRYFRIHPDEHDKDGLSAGLSNADITGKLVFSFIFTEVGTKLLHIVDRFPLTVENSRYFEGYVDNLFHQLGVVLKEVVIDPEG